MLSRLCSVGILITYALLLWLFRLHIRDLGETARTYATFRRLDLNVYTYPRTPDEQKTAASASELTPKILHQVFLSEGRNSTFDKYQLARTSCQALHPG